MVRLGVLGYGMMAQAHLIGLQSVNRARVVAIAGPNMSRARAVAETHSVPTVYADEHEMVADPDVDAVVIASPDDQHYPQTMTAIEAGKHVFVEKPVALNAVQARKMVMAARTVGVQTAVGFTLRWNPIVEHMRAMVEAGELGEIVSVHAQRFNSRLLGPLPHMEWRYDPNRSGTGVLGDLGSHMIDLAQYLAGPIEAVSADIATVIPDALDSDNEKKVPLTLDDDVVLAIRFANGAHGTIASSRVGVVDSHEPLGRSSFLINGTRAGVLTDGILHAAIHRLGHEPEPIHPNLPFGGADHAGILAVFGERMMDGFVRAILNDSEVPPTMSDGLRVQEVIDTAVEAARTGRWMTVSDVRDASG